MFETMPEGTLTNYSRSEIVRVLLFLGLALVVSRILASIVLPQYDDSFITMRYARNLASGLGFVYNANEHVLGETCPAFGLLQSLFFLVHLPMPLSVLGLNILCDVLILILTVVILYRSNLKGSAILFGLLFAVSPIISRICIGGMEMDLFLLCSLLSIALYHNEHRYIAIGIASISYFLRPEAVLLVGLLCITELLTGSKKKAFLFGALALSIVALPLYLIYSYYGSIIAQSVVAKSRWVSGSYLTMLKQLIFNDALQIILFPFMIWGFLRSWQKGGFVRTVGIWAGVYTLAYLAYRAFIFSWYGESIHYAEVLLAAIGIEDLAHRVVQKISQAKFLKLFAPTASLLAVLLWFGIFLKQGPSPVTTNVYNRLESWYKEHPLNNEKILAGDIGAIGYFSNAYIYDSDGLVWPEAREYGSESEMIKRFKPEYLFLNLTKSTEVLLQDPEVGNVYRFLAGFSPIAFNLQSLPEGWFQSYGLFQCSK